MATYMLHTADATAAFDTSTGVLMLSTMIDDTEGTDTVVMDTAQAGAKAMLGVDGLGIGVVWATNTAEVLAWLGLSGWRGG